MTYTFFGLVVCHHCSKTRRWKKRLGEYRWTSAFSSLMCCPWLEVWDWIWLISPFKWLISCWYLRNEYWINKAYCRFSSTTFLYRSFISWMVCFKWSDSLCWWWERKDKYWYWLFCLNWAFSALKIRNCSRSWVPCVSNMLYSSLY